MSRFLGFLIAWLVAAPVFAGEGASTTYLNVRGGPGTGNPVVAGLAPGEVVQIVQCNADAWCQISNAEKDGWVAARFLTAPPDAPAMDPRCRWELNTTLIEPTFQAICPPGVEPPPPPPPPGDLACFFERENYGGARTCLDPGDYLTLEAGLDNTISSVQVQGEARVRLCTEADLGGICMDNLENATALDRRMDDTASSIKVYVGFLPPPPPPPPIVHVEGEVALSLNGRANLDTGSDGPAGADIWWRRVDNATRILVPVNGAQLSMGDGSDRSLHDCRKEVFVETPVALDALKAGMVLCLKTNLGRTGRIALTEVAASGLDIAYVTWGE